jgi:hypothetical protein
MDRTICYPEPWKNRAEIDDLNARPDIAQVASIRIRPDEQKGFHHDCRNRADIEVDCGSSDQSSSSAYEMLNYLSRSIWAAHG